MAGKKHVHKYHKIEVNNELVWACAMPDCSHHMPKHYENTVIGKYSYCWNCGLKFVMDAQTMAKDMPICSDCLAGKPVEPVVSGPTIPFDITDILGMK